jgi:tetratricopeptide (TPR) repeat protein
MRRTAEAGMVSVVFLLGSGLLGWGQIESGSKTNRVAIGSETVTLPGDLSRVPPERQGWQRQMQHALDLESEGEFEEAERILIASIRKAEQPDSDPLWLPAVLDRIGGFNKHLGRNRQAEHFYVRAADLWEARFGSGSLGLAMTLSDLAWVYFGLGDASRARSLWRRSLEIRTAVLGPDHPAVARVYGYMAVGAVAAHSLGDAESFCQEALRIYERTGKIPGETDQVLSSLASVRLRQGRAPEAIQLTKEAIDLSQAAEHPSTRLLGGYFYNLALAESAAARPADAEAHFQRALSLLASNASASRKLRYNILQSYADFLSGALRIKQSRVIRKQASNLAKVIRRDSYAEDVVDVSAFR